MMKQSVRLASVVLLVAIACGGESEPAVADPSTTTASGVTTTIVTEAAVTTGTTDLGIVLVDGDGFTLYVFANDGDSVSNCLESCATSWPPVDGSTSPGAGTDPNAFSSIERQDGSTQLAINGQPLYRFAGDTAPGDANGHGVQEIWFAVGPGGERIADSPGSDLPADDYGYDY